MQPFRLLPVLLFAITSLLALKLAGLLTGANGIGGPPSALAQAASPQAIESRPAAETRQAPEAAAFSATLSKRSWAQEMLGYPDVTGSVSTPAKPPAPAEGAPQKATPDANGAASKPKGGATPPATEAERALPAGERVVLERLGERRQELEAQARELEIRENLLKAAELRMEARLMELNELEARINASAGKKGEEDAARIKSLVTMYENMKAKEAAKIFDRLDMKVLLEVATKVNPRRMSDILAQMTPDAAERLTVELAGGGAGAGKQPATADLPKIEGKQRM